MRIVIQLAILALVALTAAAQSTDISPVSLPAVAYKSGDAEFIQTLQVSHDKLRRGTDMQIRYILNCWSDMCINGVESPEDHLMAPQVEVQLSPPLQLALPKPDRPLRKDAKWRCAYPNYLIRIRAPRDTPLGTYTFKLRLKWQPRGKDGVLSPQITAFEMPIEVVEHDDKSVRVDKGNFTLNSPWGLIWRSAAFPFYMAGCAAAATVGKPYCIE